MMDFVQNVLRTVMLVGPWRTPLRSPPFRGANGGLAPTKGRAWPHGLRQACQAEPGARGGPRRPAPVRFIDGDEDSKDTPRAQRKRYK